MNDYLITLAALQRRPKRSRCNSFTDQRPFDARMACISRPKAKACSGSMNFLISRNSALSLLCDLMTETRKTHDARRNVSSTANSCDCRRDSDRMGHVPGEKNNGA